MTESSPLRFLAMEYYLLVWNRTFDVTLTPSALCGAFVRGVRSGSAMDIVTARAEEDVDWLADPMRLRLARALEPGSPAHLALHRFNFAIPQPSIASVRFDPTPKWGMGPVPHAGRLHVETRDGRRRELILLGWPDPAAIVGTARDLGYPATLA